MHLSIVSTLNYAVPQPVDLLLQIEAAATPEQRIISTHIDLPECEHFTRVPAQSDIGERMWLHTANPLLIRYEATIQIDRVTQPLETLQATPPYLLPGDVIEYLMPSRYCPSDTFHDFAVSEFGHLEGGVRVAAIRDWIGQNLIYQPGSSDTYTTAADTFQSGIGVCRDYAHLMIVLTRASDIPARFVSVYGLGVKPQDFHAVTEVYLDGTWHLVDATGMCAPHQMVKIGVGRDAADVAFLSAFGSIEMVSQSVSVMEIKPSHNAKSPEAAI